MEAVLQDDLFPGLTSSPARRRSVLGEFMEAFEKHGPMVTVNVAAAGIGISRQRVWQLINAGRIATVEVHGRQYVPIAALELFCSEDRPPGGRPATLNEKLLKAYGRVSK